MAKPVPFKAVNNIIIVQDDPDDFPEDGPQNSEEARSYIEKLDSIFSTMDDMLQDDRKDMLHVTVAALKNIMVKHWQQMSEANIDLVMKAIQDPSCVYLWEHLMPEGPDVMEPTMDIPITWEFICQLPKKKRKQEVCELITTTFYHLGKAHAHMSSYAVNMSSLAKIANPDTFDAVLKATTRPMIQVNIPERFLSPFSEPKPKTMAEEQLLKLEKVLLP